MQKNEQSVAKLAFALCITLFTRAPSRSCHATPRDGTEVVLLTRGDVTDNNNRRRSSQFSLYFAN